MPGKEGLIRLIKVYIARHGETAWNAEGRIQGQSDPGLNEKGYAQSLALLEKVKDRPIAAIYTSTLQRSIATAEAIAKHLGLFIQKRRELDEIAFGIFEGRQLSEIEGELRSEWERFRKNRLTYHIPGAENYTDVSNRLRPFKDEILRNHHDQEILIVGHRGANRMLIGLLLEYPLEKALKIEQTNDCLYLVQRNCEMKVFHTINGEAREGLLSEDDLIL